MRIFKDVSLVEQLGSGIPRIMEVYPREAFIFTDNFLRMTFKNKNTEHKDNELRDDILKYASIKASINPMQFKILDFCISPKSNATIQEECLGLTKHTKNFNNYIKPLLELGYLVRTIPDNPKDRNQKYVVLEEIKKFLF